MTPFLVSANENGPVQYKTNFTHFLVFLVNSVKKLEVKNACKSCSYKKATELNLCEVSTLFYPSERFKAIFNMCPHFLCIGLPALSL